MKEAYTPLFNDNAENKYHAFYSDWLPLVIVAIVIYCVAPQDAHSNDSLKSKSPSPIYKVPSEYIESPMPYHSEILPHTDDIRMAPFEIQTSQEANYLVKLVPIYSRKPVITVLVRGGNNVTTEVPLGTYELKYASGKKWYGYTNLFGPSTVYMKADETFTFHKTGNQITGYTITLYPVPNGNLRTLIIDPSEF